MTTLDLTACCSWCQQESEVDPHPACAAEMERYAEAQTRYDVPALWQHPPCAMGCRLDEDNPQHAYGCSDYPY